jgi:flagellar basal body-associated protein FliL
MTVLIIIIIIDLLVVGAVMYWGSRGHNETPNEAQDSPSTLSYSQKAGIDLSPPAQPEAAQTTVYATNDDAATDALKADEADPDSTPQAASTETTNRQAESG